MSERIRLQASDRVGRYLAISMSDWLFDGIERVHRRE